MMQQQMCQMDQTGQPQQVMLCPVRLVYETQILVQPGEQIQPNQTLFINQQNTPPWIQNQARPQNQVIYMQQMPGNMISSVPQQMDQNQMYLQNLQGYYPQQMIQMDPRQMSNVVQMMPNINNISQITGQNVHLGQNIINVGQHVNNIGPNVINTGQMQTNVVQNVQKPGNVGVNIAQNQTNMASIVSNDRVYNNTNAMQNTMPMANQNTMTNVTQIHDRTGNMNQNLMNMQKVAELQGMRQQNVRQPQVTVSPMQNVKYATNTVDIRPITQPNVGDIRAVNSPRPMTSNIPNNVLQANALHKKVPLTNKPNPTVMTNPVRHYNQTYYRHIQPKPMSVTPMQNQYLPTGSQTLIGPRPTQIVSEVSRKRKSESPDETRRKVPNITNHTVSVLETGNGTTISYIPTPVRDFKLVSRNVETTSTGTQANIAKERPQVVDMKTIPSSKDNVQVESDKLVRNTVFTQARGLLRTEPQNSPSVQPDVIIRIDKLHSPSKVTPAEPMTIVKSEANAELAKIETLKPNTEVVKIETTKTNTEIAKPEPFTPNIEVFKLETPKPTTEPVKITTSKPITEPVRVDCNTPKLIKEPVRIETPKLIKEPVRMETPKFIQEPVRMETPKFIQEPVRMDTPRPITESVRMDTPRPITEPVRMDTPRPITEPVRMDTPRPITEPVRMDTPRPITVPVKMDTPKARFTPYRLNKEFEKQKPSANNQPPPPNKLELVKIEKRSYAETPRMNTGRTPETKTLKHNTKPPKIETITKAESKSKEVKPAVKVKKEENSKTSKLNVKEEKTSEATKSEVETKPTKLEAKEVKEVNKKFTVTSINDFKGNELQIAEGSVRKEDTDHYILTHVLDGYVIQESNTAFPIRKPLKEKIIYQNADMSLEPKKEETYKHRTEDGKLIKDNSKILSISDLNLNEEEEIKSEVEAMKSEEEAVKSEEEKREEKCDEVSDSDQPFADLTPSTVQSWTVDQLASHLSKYSWAETISVLSDHEIDGESLFLVNKQQLVQIGVSETHADVICEFIKNS